MKELVEDLHCFHCGEEIRQEKIEKDNKVFCCEGCSTVYEILNENDLCNYYELNQNPGKSLKERSSKDYSFLTTPEIAEKFIRFKDESVVHLKFTIPSIHCSSCIWLLENLQRLHSGILRSRVNFVRKEVSIVADHTQIGIEQVADLLDRLGYAPHTGLDQLESAKMLSSSYFDKTYFYKLGIAFFCFGNIMLLSFPEYLGVDALADSPYRRLFGYLNFGLSLPVLLYSAGEFFRSAWGGVRGRSLNMDFPIALGILIMFLWSSYEIFSQKGAGYMDTLSSLVFLMLVGRALQNMTYGRISFDRDYRSYFPIAITRIKNGNVETIPVNAIEKGDRLVIRNNEIIPADTILLKGNAEIDYSFVTGESVPVGKVLGEMLFAGGKQKGNPIEVEVIKEVSHSYLTQLWNEDQADSESQKEKWTSMANRISKYFTLIILTIASLAAAYWWREDPEKALFVFTSVLIITCPCALALSTPFALGTAIRVFGRKKLYLKNAPVVERMSEITHIVFDKTGTITQSKKADVQFDGERLSDEEIKIIRSMTFNSIHPLSKSIFDSLPVFPSLVFDVYKEIPSKGISAELKNKNYFLGKRIGQSEEKNHSEGSEVFFYVDGLLRGKFSIHNSYRDQLPELISGLKELYTLKVLTGDNDSERANLEKIFGKDVDIRYRQTPYEKLECVKELQQSGRKVLMLGDGLNDAGALKQSDVGISISEDVNNFSPACDGLLDGSMFGYLKHFLSLSRSAVAVVKLSFALSFLYNIVGIWFAVQGALSPLVAALLMPLSSISVILLTTLGVNASARRIFHS